MAKKPKFENFWSQFSRLPSGERELALHLSVLYEVSGRPSEESLETARPHACQKMSRIAEALRTGNPPNSEDVEYFNWALDLYESLGRLPS